MDEFYKWIKFWRERYCWPLPKGRDPSEEDRTASEKKIAQVENQMRIGILKGLPYDVRKDLGEVILWKVSPSHQESSLKLFEGNTEEFLIEKMNEVFSILSANPNDVANAINPLVKIKGVGIPFASAILRFMDPEAHRYEVIDTNVARFLNERRETNFELNVQHRIKNYPPDSLKRNIDEYQKYHNWLQQISLDLRKGNVTYVGIDKNQHPFQPVDIDMAIFAFMTQTRPREARLEPVSVPAKDLEMHPATPFTNLNQLYELMRTLRGLVQLLDKDLGIEALKFLIHLNPSNVKKAKILFGKSHLSSIFKEECKAFRDEMLNKGISVEFRILDDKDAQEIHDRYLISDHVAYNTPPWNIIHKKLGDVKFIQDHSSKRYLFDKYWSRATDISRIRTKY